MVRAAQAADPEQQPDGQMDMYGMRSTETLREAVFAARRPIGPNARPQVRERSLLAGGLGLPQGKGPSAFSRLRHALSARQQAAERTAESRAVEEVAPRGFQRQFTNLRYVPEPRRKGSFEKDHRGKVPGHRASRRAQGWDVKPRGVRLDRGKVVLQGPAHARLIFERSMQAAKRKADAAERARQEVQAPDQVSPSA